MRRLIQNKNIAIIIFLFITSCAGNDENITLTYLDEFKLPKITLKSVAVPQVKQAAPKMIGLIGDTLMVIDNDKNPYLNFYDLNELKFLGSYGAHGRDPNQFMNPKYANQFFYNKNSVNFVVADASKFTLSVLDLNKILKNENSLPEHTYRVPPQLILSYVSMFITPDSTLIGNYRGNKSNSGRFFSYDLKSNNISWINYFPKANLNIPTRSMALYYYSTVSYNSQKNLMVSAMRNFKELDFINTKDNTIQSNVFTSSKNHYPSLDPTKSVARNNKIFYLESFSTNNFIYATCVNNENSVYSKGNGKLELHIFDWEGKKVNMLLLDRIKLGSFVVDEKRHKIYAVNFEKDKEKLPIVQYNY